jgi:hypothetical protein
MLGGLFLGGVAGVLIGPIVGALLSGESRIDFAPRPGSRDLPSSPPAPAAPDPNLYR